MSISGKISSEEISYSMDLPEPPAKPLDSDCCGTGCTPCVFDIYDEEMLRWKKECERIRSGTTDVALRNGEPVQILSLSEFRTFALESIKRLTRDSCLFRFIIPENRKLGLKIGQHLIMRWSVCFYCMTRYAGGKSDCSNWFFLGRDFVIKAVSMEMVISHVFLAQVPYNKLLTDQACSSPSGKHWSSVIFIQTLLLFVCFAVTLGQYFTVHFSCLVSKRFLKYIF